jgi:lipopolysaccharide transport system ATP-binding protein
LEKDIVEFAELEQFIDQPVKTYSAGMYARLAFTVATAIEPEILIIDEILGAGDAYFNAKALERMSELTNGGSTVLFVSHDLSSVQKICDRTIWIDRGKIRKDGKTLEVIKAYSADVRKREELRLLAKNTGVLLDKNDLENNRQYIFRFITSDAKAPKTGFIIHKISLYKGNLLIEDILVGDSMDNSILENAHLITDKRLINWGEPKKIDEKWCREFIDIGGKNIHAAGVFIVNDDIEDELYFEIEYKDTATEIINFEVYSEENNSYQTLCQLVPAQSGKWLKKRIKYIQQKKEENPKDDISSEDIYGSNELTITKFQILDKNLQESYVITINQESHFRIWFKVNSDIEIKQPVFVVAFYSFDGTVISQMISKEKNFKIDSLKGEGYVDFIITSLKIGAGEYNLSVGIFHDIDLVNPIEQNAYCLHDRKYSVKIEQPFGLNMPLGLVYQDFDFSYKVLNG